MILEPGSKIHVVTRRAFEADSPRHFVGEVLEATEVLATAEGFAFVRDPNRNQFARRPDARVRIISLVDAANVIFILPRDVDVASVTYTLTDKQRLIVTDGKNLQLDITEFGGGR
jgi:hypothetical protein